MKDYIAEIIPLDEHFRPRETFLVADEDLKVAEPRAIEPDFELVLEEHFHFVLYI